MDPIVRPHWMSQVMYDEWLRLYADAGGSGVAGSADRATEQFRDLPQYDAWFPGIRREDGALRYPSNPEATYYNNIASYRNTVEGLLIDPDVFNEDYINLIEGDTSPAEFAQRANAEHERILSSGVDTREWYANSLGLNMTDEGLLASLLSPRVEQAVFERRITMAEIGGQASMRNFDITTEFVGLLEQAGMDLREAQQMFGSADRMLPMLGALAARHGDPDDTFDIREFAQAATLDDPEQLARLDRLRAQEESTFTGGKQLEVASSRETGGLTGLTDV